MGTQPAMAFVVKEELADDETEAESDATLSLIALVRATPFIYDHRDHRHKDRARNAEAWTRIGLALGISKDEAKDKWKRLRNNFGKSVERRKRRSPARACKPWVYEAQMDFLRKFLTNRRPGPGALRSQRLHSSADSPAQTDTLPSPQPEAPAPPPDVAAPPEFPAEPLPGPEGTARPRAVPAEAGEAALGWFRALLPMIATLSPIGQLDFQARVVHELKAALLREEQQHRN